MSIFNEFPYTNFHEMNLDWIIARVKEWLAIAENWETWKDDTDQAIKDLKAYIDSYFDNLDIQEEINNKLDEMAADGTLERIIDDYLGDLRGIIENMTPTPEDREEYKDMIRRNLVSYLVRNNFSTCINGNPVNTDYRVIFKYAIGKGYMGLFGAGSFVRNDVETIGGVDYKVAYFDCTGFVSMVTRGRAFNDSPYAYAFSHPGATDEELRPYAMEDPTPDMDYTFDCLNNIRTDNASRIMNNSGNTLQLIKHIPGGSIDQNVLNKLETGDIVWAGSPEHRPNNYKNIYHCMLYVKTLEELNEYAINYGITFRSADSFDGSNGYVVEVWNEGSVAYQDKLIIHTLNYWLNTVVLGETQNVYMTKSYANSDNSNKQYSLVSGMYRLYDDTFVVNTCSYGEIKFPESKIKFNIAPEGAFVGGRPMQLNNINIDTMNTSEYSGIWMPYNAEDLASLSGTLPAMPENTFFTLIILGADITGKSAKQILIASTVTQNVKNLIFIRQTGISNNIYGSWREIGSTIKSGTYAKQSVAGGGYRDTVITFDEPFNYTPVVVPSLFMEGTSGSYGSIAISAINITPTGFTARIFHAGSGNANVGFNWIAH